MFRYEENGIVHHSEVLIGETEYYVQEKIEELVTEIERQMWKGEIFSFLKPLKPKHIIIDENMEVRIEDKTQLTH